MKLRNVFQPVLSGAAAMFGATAALAVFATFAFAADVPADSLKFGTDVVKAANGYETPAASYVVANPTNVFNDHFYYGTKVTGRLDRGENVEALAKVKGYEWLLVGRNGTGVGYVPISMLAPAESPPLGPDVVKAENGYEPVTASYIVANSTNVFSNHFYFGTKVTGELKRGEHVDALAKVKGYDWVLVGRNGTGIGYVPISMLSPADLYHP